MEIFKIVFVVVMNIDRKITIKKMRGVFHGERN